MDGGGEAGFGEAGVVGDVWRWWLLEVISEIAAASESLSSVISRSQSALPVEITICEAGCNMGLGRQKNGKAGAHLAVVRLDTAQHVCVHVDVETTRIRFMAYGTWSELLELSDNLVARTDPGHKGRHMPCNQRLKQGRRMRVGSDIEGPPGGQRRWTGGL